MVKGLFVKYIYIFLVLLFYFRAVHISRHHAKGGPFLFDNLQEDKMTV